MAGDQSPVKNFIHRSDKNQLDLVEHRSWNFSSIPLIFLRHQHGVNPGPVCGNDFLFQAADRQDPAAQGDLAGHGDIAANRTAAQGRGQGRRQGDAGGWAIFGRCAFGDMDMDVTAWRRNLSAMPRLAACERI